jgi:phosphatidylglycerophosphatase C
LLIVLRVVDPARREMQDHGRCYGRADRTIPVMASLGRPPTSAHIASTEPFVYQTRMEATSVEALLSRLEGLARERPGGAIAFDGDGTLWSGDVGEDYFAELVERRALPEAARAPLSEVAAEHGLSGEGSARALAERIHHAYIAGRFPEDTVCEVMTWALAGTPRAAVDELARDVAAGLGLAGRLHAEAIAVARWAVERGVAVFVVSASPRPIVEAASEHLGVSVAGVAAVTPRWGSDGVMLPEVERPIPYGDGKVTRLTELLAGRPLYAAFGDNAFDVAMLNAAAIGVAVRPKARLRERAADVPGLLELSAG